MLRRRLVVLALTVLALASCGPRMPSTVPLGRGPLAGPIEPRRTSATPRVKPAPVVGETTPPSAAPVATDEEEKEEGEETDPSDEGDAAADPSAQQPADVAGLYTGEDETRYLLDGAPERTEKDPNAKTRVDLKDGVWSFTLVDSSNGKEICTLRGRQGESAIEIEPDQECFSQSGDAASTKGVVKKGTAKLSDGTLTLELELDFEVSAGDRTISGTVQYRFEGRRK